MDVIIRRKDKRGDVALRVPHVIDQDGTVFIDDHVAFGAVEMIRDAVQQFPTAEPKD
jgi:hypothetical protein